MKKLLALLTCLAAALFARAEGDLMMYWMIDQTDADPSSFSYAMIAISGEGIEEKVYLTVDGCVEFIPVDISLETGFGTKTEDAYASLAPLADYNLQALGFAVELYNTVGQMIGVSDVVAYAYLRENGYIYRDMDVSGLVPYVFTAVAIPEPTGGVLVLLGLGLLGLRRKRV